MRTMRGLSNLCPLVLATQIFASPAPPLVCPGGAPLGWIRLTVARESGGPARNIQTVNRIFEGYQVSYRPVHIDSADAKKARIALLLVPSDGSKIEVFDSQPADRAVSWAVPFRTRFVSLVWGPGGLDNAKVKDLMTKNTDLVGQLADYAAKSEETQALIEAISKQQALDTGQSVDAAVAGFASQFPAVKLDRTQPADVQLGVLLQSVNPSLTAYDPLAQSPQQQAAQTAGLAAAVGGLFLGATGGLAATGGAVLVNLHSLLFPRTTFLSALAQEGNGETASLTGLCGSKAPPLARTESAYLWALRIPDAPAPEMSLPANQHVPIGIQSSVALKLKGGDWKLIPRVQQWRLVSEDYVSVPVSATVNTAAKTVALNLENPKLKPGLWTLAANWDWDPIAVSGSLALHSFPQFRSAHLTPASQDKLIAGAGTVDLELTGDDFEFVRKVEYKRRDDPFAQPQGIPFLLPKEPAGPENSMKVRIDAKNLATGDYEFEIAQADDKIHETPFKVLPPRPVITGTPIVLNTGAEDVEVTLHGAGLDRIETISAEHAQFTLGDAGNGTERTVAVKLDSGIKPGTMVTLHVKAKDFEEPFAVADVFAIAGPAPEITTVRRSAQGTPGVSLQPGEIAADAPVGFEIGVQHAPGISALDLSCGDANLRISPGDAKQNAKLTVESTGLVFLSFRPDQIGLGTCTAAATLITAHSGQSAPHTLGRIVLLPHIDSFQITDEKAGDNSWFAVIEGRDLEGISKVGWDAANGTAVDAIPAPVAGPGNRESLRVAMPWPAPAPHAPLYVWLRGEEQGRMTVARE